MRLLQSSETVSSSVSGEAVPLQDGCWIELCAGYEARCYGMLS